MEQTRISHYAIGRRLGRGGMGEVFDATDLDLDRPVALKFVAADLDASPDALRRLEHEARAAAALQHPHIATLYAFERDGGRSFIAMERMTGGSLRERLKGGALPISQALGIARDTAAALAHAHRRGIVHRDVKPENLMFGEGGIVKLMDFGLARATQASRMTMTGSTVGTAAYMAPESMRDGTGPWSDVFALGVTLYEMLAGALPFGGDTPLALLYSAANEPPRPLRAKRSDAPATVEALVMRMLDKDPAARPDAVEVARELAGMTGVPTPLGARDEEDATQVIGMPGAGAGAPPAARRGVRLLLIALFPIAALAGLLGVLLPGALRERGDARRQEAIALNNRGFDLMEHDSLPAAAAALQAALEADKHYPKAMLNLAEVRRRTGDATGAAVLFGRVIEERPDDLTLVGNAHYGLAEIDMGSGAFPSAIDHYRQALAVDSTNVAYFNNLAFALVQAGRPGEALPVLNAGIARFPGAAQLHKNLGLAHLRIGGLPEAITALDAALDRDPALASALGLRAEARARMGDLAGARADWDTYLGMLHDETERPAIEAQLRRLGALTN